MKSSLIFDFFESGKVNIQNDYDKQDTYIIAMS